jgi:hypothetical protein
MAVEWKRLSFVDSLEISLGAETKTLDSISDSEAKGIRWDYVLDDGTNSRAGSIIANWDTAADSSPKIAEIHNDTKDDTSDVNAFIVDKSTNLVRLRATSSSAGWTVYLERYLIGRQN